MWVFLFSRYFLGLLMNLMRGPKEEVVAVVEEEEKFGPMKPLPPPPVEEPPPPAPGEAQREHSLEKSPTPHSSGEESGETTAEEGGESPKEEQVTLQDLLGYVATFCITISFCSS